MERPRLERSVDDRVIAGVGAGLAAHLRLPVAPVRAALAVSALLGGAGVLLYLWLWALVPRAGETEPVLPLKRALTRPATSEPWHPSDAGQDLQRSASQQAEATGSRIGPHQDEADGATDLDRSARRWRAGTWPIAELLLGLALLLAGVGLALDRLGAQVDFSFLLPALAVCVGVGLTWWNIADRGGSDQGGARRNLLPRVLGALALVAVGVLMFFVTAREPSAWTVIAAAIAVLAGVALAISPWLLRVNRELIAERAARAREAERSDIAAHLHDSVLQTLALIQQRSEAGSDVSRLARRQEQELRAWLFRGADGTAATDAAIDTELRAHAAALETDHAVRFEFVSVGAGTGTHAPAAIVAAAREAMLNAARHAGGDVTVFLEASPTRITIDITDRGPGLNLLELPEGRMGVRESILGRMERAGGTATIVKGPGGGTSVRLGMERSPREAADIAPGSAAPGSAASGERTP